MKLDIYLNCGSPGADIVVTLVDATPTGEAYNVADGVIRSKSANGRLSIELGDTAYEFARGHRLGLHIAGSSFPRYDRRPQTTTFDVLHGMDHPTALILPVQAQD